jgi:hypothetical protein
MTHGAYKWRIAADLRPMCVRALRRMYDKELNLFCFTMRRGPNGEQPEGVSHRYTAITLIGLAAQYEDLSEQIMGEGGKDASYRQLLGDVPHMTSLGDVALSLWAAVASQRPETEKVYESLLRFDPALAPHPTVEIAWALTALCYSPRFFTDSKLADALANRLLKSFNADAGLFPHWQGEPRTQAWRAHVTCFADWVYPVHALSHYHMLSQSEPAIEAARLSAGRMSRLQGRGGQWWWHYDVRNGHVLESYPVYAVHQDAMAPMAFFALEDACGAKYDECILRGLEWLLKSPERNDSLIDHQADLIWRKVARWEPGKFVRGAQAFMSRIHPSLRFPAVNLFFPAAVIDHECRPYHLGWLLYAFSDRRIKGSLSKPTNDS